MLHNAPKSVLQNVEKYQSPKRKRNGIPTPSKKSNVLRANHVPISDSALTKALSVNMERKNADEIHRQNYSIDTTAQSSFNTSTNDSINSTCADSLPLTPPSSPLSFSICPRLFGAKAANSPRATDLYHNDLHSTTLASISPISHSSCQLDHEEPTQGTENRQLDSSPVFFDDEFEDFDEKPCGEKISSLRSLSNLNRKLTLTDDDCLIDHVDQECCNNFDGDEADNDDSFNNTISELASSPLPGSSVRLSMTPSSMHNLNYSSNQTNQLGSSSVGGGGVTTDSLKSVLFHSTVKRGATGDDVMGNDNSGVTGMMSALRVGCNHGGSERGYSSSSSSSHSLSKSAGLSRVILPSVDRNCMSQSRTSGASTQLWPSRDIFDNSSQYGSGDGDEDGALGHPSPILPFGKGSFNELLCKASRDQDEDDEDDRTNATSPADDTDDEEGYHVNNNSLEDRLCNVSSEKHNCSLPPLSRSSRHAEADENNFMHRKNSAQSLFLESVLSPAGHSQYDTLLADSSATPCTSASSLADKDTTTGAMQSLPRSRSQDCLKSRLEKSGADHADESKSCNTSVHSQLVLPDQSCFDVCNGSAGADYSFLSSPGTTEDTLTITRASSLTSSEGASSPITTPNKTACPGTPVRERAWVVRQEAEEQPAVEESDGDFLLRRTNSNSTGCAVSTGFLPALSNHRHHQHYNSNQNNDDCDDNNNNNNNNNNNSALNSTSRNSSRSSIIFEDKQLDKSARCYKNDFEPLGHLGSGTFGDVYKARHRLSGKLCAVKISRQQFRSKKDKELSVNEVMIMECIGVKPCINIINLIDAWYEDKYMYVQLDLAENGTVKDLLTTLSCGPGSFEVDPNFVARKFGQGKQGATPVATTTHSKYARQESGSAFVVSDVTVLHIMHDVCNGLRHIHACGFVHLDIKPANLLIGSGGVIKIADFGLAIKQGEGEDGREGDTRYMAPELLNSSRRHSSADMFSFALSMYEVCMTTRDSVVQMPTEGLMWHTLRDNSARPVSGRKQQIVEVIQQSMMRDPEQRLSAAAVVSYSSVREVENEMDSILCSAVRPPTPRPAHPSSYNSSSNNSQMSSFYRFTNNSVAPVPIARPNGKLRSFHRNEE